MKFNPNNKGGRSPHKSPTGGGGLKQLQNRGSGVGKGGFVTKSKNFKNKFSSPASTPGGGSGGGGKFRGDRGSGGGAGNSNAQRQGFKNTGKGPSFKKGANGKVGNGSNKQGNRNKNSKFQNKSRFGRGKGFKKPSYDPNNPDGGEDSNSDAEEEPSNPNFIQVKRQDKKNKVVDDGELEIATMEEQFKSFKDIKTFDEDGDNEDSEDEDDFMKDAAGSGGGSGVTGPKGSKKKTGGFQSMGLSELVLKGVIRRGYKVPTPIQRKVN